MTLLNTNNCKMVNQSQPWFKVYDLGRRIYAISEPYQKQQVISYLIIGDTDAILLDTGLGVGNIKKLVFELWSIMPTVINSNACLGHCGGNDKFDLVSIMNTPSIIDAMTKGFDENWNNEHYGKDSISPEAPEGYENDEFNFKPSLFTTVSDGTFYPLGNRTIEVVSGKTLKMNGLMLADDTNKVLFTGDIFYQPLIEQLDDEVKNDYIAELKDIIAEYKDYTWLFSHGKPQDEELKEELIKLYA